VTEGWTAVRKADGKKVKHHVTYELELPDGRVLRTRISPPPNKQTYGTALWSHILRDQLAVDDATFWTCARDGVRPHRGQPEPVGETIPADLVQLLKRRMHLTDAEIADMSKREAIEAANRFWGQGSD
jgi:hypothetical protein